MPKLLSAEKKLLDEIVRQRNYRNACHTLGITRKKGNEMMYRIRRRYLESMKLMGLINSYKGKSDILRKRLTPKVKVEKTEENDPLFYEMFMRGDKSVDEIIREI